MKALLISDRSEIIDFVTPLLKAKSFDLIHYRWIIKALDNIEEIQPDVIVLSAMEYPRHWKTLAGFVQSGIGGNDVKMYLYDTEPLSKEDRDKACDLGILSFTESFKESRIISVELALNEPGKGQLEFYRGKYFPEEKYLQVDDEFTDEIGSSLESSFIKYVTVYDGSKADSFSAEVKKENAHIRLYVKDYYEKKI